jgi:hypothetical protein
MEKIDLRPTADPQDTEDERERQARERLHSRSVSTSGNCCSMVRTLDRP